MNFKIYMEYVKKTFPIVKKHIIKNIGYILLSQIAALLTLTIPLLTKSLIDDVLLTSNYGRLVGVLCMMGGVFLTSAVLGFVSNYYGTIFTESAAIEAREKLYKKILKMNMRFFTTEKVGNMTSRLHEDSNYIHGLIAYMLDSVIKNVLTLIVITIIIFKLNWILAVISLITLPVFVVSNSIFNKKLRIQSYVIREKRNQIMNFFINSFSKILIIRNFNCEERENIKHKELSRDYKQEAIKGEMIGYAANILVGILSNINTLVTLGVGGYFVMKGEITLGALIAFNSYLKHIYNPIIRLSRTMSASSRVMASIKRYFEYYDRDEMEIDGTEKDVNFEGDLIFKEVGFSYDDNAVYEGMNLNIKGNEKVLILGESGIGKSTLSYLLKRFYVVDSGEIRIGDVPINHIGLKHLRANIGYLSQEAFLVDGTIKENMAMAKEQVFDEEIIDALKKARIYDYIKELPNGLNEYVGNNGANLSGGQRQRLSIARLFIQNPPVVVFDEIFKGLDVKIENEIWGVLQEFCKEKTTIFISHKIKDPEYFDKICMTENRIIKCYTGYEEFIEKYGLYKLEF